MKKLITKTTACLNSKGVILYPTDTIWGLGCDATNFEAVQKIYKIKQRENSKSMIVLVNSMAMLKEYVSGMSVLIQSYLKSTERPTTVIYKLPNNLAKNVIAKDNTIAIRIVESGFAHELISKFKKPIVSTSANISNKLPPEKFELIDKHILNKVDFIVTLPNYKNTSNPSVIIKEVNNKIEFIRK